MAVIVPAGHYQFPSIRHRLAPPPAPHIKVSPMKITKGPQFGKSDPDLARVVMRSIERTMPPIVIPFQRNYYKLHELLRKHGFYDANLHHVSDIVQDDRITPEGETP